MGMFKKVMLLAVILTFIPALSGCGAAGAVAFEPTTAWTGEGPSAPHETALTPVDVVHEATKYMGLTEGAGAASNPVIVDMLYAVGIRSSLLTDSTAWCGAFVNHVLETMGLPSPKSALARAYVDVGVEVSVTEAVPGDIVTIWRESISSWKGHVGIVYSIDLEAGIITILGGNQSDMVRLETYPLSRVLAIRRVV